MMLAMVAILVMVVLVVMVVMVLGPKIQQTSTGARRICPLNPQLLFNGYYLLKSKILYCADFSVMHCALLYCLGAPSTIMSAFLFYLRW